MTQNTHVSHSEVCSHTVSLISYLY